MLARRPDLRLLCLFAFAAPLAGCAEDEGPGTLVVPFQFPAPFTCADLDVDQVRVQLGDDDVGINSRDTCTSGEVRLVDVPAGRYEMLVEGLNTQNIAVTDNLADPREARLVEVLGDGATVTVSPEVVLTTAPAKLEIAIDFLASSCTGSGITNFDVRTSDDAAGSLLQYDLPCDDSVEGFVAIPDPDRELRGNDFTSISVQPLDASRTAVGLAVQQTFEPPGPGQTVRLLLRDCDSNGCPSSSLR